MRQWLTQPLAHVSSASHAAILSRIPSQRVNSSFGVHAFKRLSCRPLAFYSVNATLSETCPSALPGTKYRHIFSKYTCTYFWYSTQNTHALFWYITHVDKNMSYHIESNQTCSFQSQSNHIKTCNIWRVQDGSGRKLNEFKRQCACTQVAINQRKPDLGNVIINANHDPNHDW